MLECIKVNMRVYHIMTVTGNGKLISHHSPAQPSPAQLLTWWSNYFNFLNDQFEIRRRPIPTTDWSGETWPGVSKYLMCWCVDIVESRLYSSWEIKVMATGSAENLDDLNQIKYPIRLISKYFDNATFYRNTLPLRLPNLSRSKF